MQGNFKSLVFLFFKADYNYVLFNEPEINAHSHE